MKKSVIGLLLGCAALACLATPAFAGDAYPGMKHLPFAAGPYRITPGANLILLDTNHVPKQSQDGYIVRMAPNRRYARPDGKCCGGIPRVDDIHLHHGVWLSNGTAGEGEGTGLARSTHSWPPARRRRSTSSRTAMGTRCVLRTSGSSTT